MSDAPASALDTALVLTAAMADAAARNDWQAVLTLDAKRRNLLEQACAQPDVDAARLATLRERNDQLIALVHAQRDGLVGEWRESRYSQRALQDYQRVARDQGA